MVLKTKLWHTLEPASLFEAFRVDPGRGLSRRDAAGRLQRYGANAIVRRRQTSPAVIFLSQFKDFMIMVLLGATLISALLGEVADAITITAIVLLNAVLGFIQEYRAERSLEALQELSAPRARVRRDGMLLEIAAAELVPGDIIELEAGDRVPADARLVELAFLQVDESVLTGESLPVSKTLSVGRATSSNPGDCQNMVYMGTSITGGRGLACVVATGMRTEIGRIAGMMQRITVEATPLQVRLEQLGRWLVLACLAVCAAVSLTGIIRGEPVYTMFMAGVSLAVAAIPEGLPAIVTVALALGVQRMVRRNALIRKLPAVETLGCATVICSDKTGTLTENKMTVRQLYLGGRQLTVTGGGYAPEGDFLAAGRKVEPANDPDLRLLLEAGVFCNNAQLEEENAAGVGAVRKVMKLLSAAKSVWAVRGDPTEGALLVAAAKAGLALPGQRYQRVGEIPFDSDRKRMSVLCRGPQGESVLFLKGAPESTIDRCGTIAVGGKISKLDPAGRSKLLAANEAMAGDALRVLAVAYRRLPGLPAAIEAEDLEKDLVFLGLVGMVDPPRPEVKAAVEKCRRAGIRTVMVTGDHLATAVAVAREIGLLSDASDVLSGADVDAMSEADLARSAATVNVYARVSPRHKLRIVKALRRGGQVVAMTGDGVNDAPAVKEADIGIAMGRTGTDVTKEAAAMVLLDDNFATIVAAIEEGRGIYDNIRKFIRYLLACNVGEVLTMFLAALTGMPLPLLPVQVLWVNLVTDGLPAIALGVDPAEKDIMQRPPRGIKESIFARGLARKIYGRGLLIGVSTVAVFAGCLYGAGASLMRARTLAFATLVLCQLVHVFDCRSERRSLLELNWLTNISLLLAVLCSLAMTLAAIYVPQLQTVFETVGLSAAEWLLVLFVAGAGSIAVGLRRVLLAWRLRGRPDTDR